jgi:Mg/Co/Ni transporter MgtE
MEFGIDPALATGPFITTIFVESNLFLDPQKKLF